MRAPTMSAESISPDAIRILLLLGWPVAKLGPASMVKMLDDHVGIIMNELEVQGIADNTLVIFSVDNGHEIYYEPDQRLSYDQGKGILSDKYDSEKHGDVFNGNENRSDQPDRLTTDS